MYNTSDELLWYALQVGSKKEDVVATLLSQKGYEPFSPAYQAEVPAISKAVNPRRKLFPGYVFCRFAYGAAGRLIREGRSVVTTPGVIRILGGPSPMPIPTEEIEAIQVALAARLKPEPWSYQTGQKVQMEGGPLRGMYGVVVRSDGKRRLVLSIDMLHRSVAVTVEAAWISPVDLIRDAIDDARTLVSQQQNQMQLEMGQCWPDNLGELSVDALSNTR